MLDARSNTPILSIIRPKKVRSGLLTLRPFFVITLAFVFLLNSIGGGLFIGESWAAGPSAGLTSVGPDKTGGSPTPLKELNAGTFTMPQELGYVQESTDVPGSTRTVIHIQDAHCNYAAQKSIAGILNYLTTEYGIDAVNCEGAAKGYDLSVFTDIPEQDIREKTADFFVREGVVSAAEYFAVNNPQKVRLWGIEDADLYIKNLKIYRDSLSYKNDADYLLKSIGYMLDNLKKHIYSGKMLEFDAYYTKYKDNKITLKEYVSYLLALAEKEMINVKSFSNIYLLSQALEQEGKIDFRRADNEKDEVVAALKKVLSRNEMEELIAKVAQMKTEHISQSDFYAYLVRKAKSIKLELNDYPQLQKYIVYISIYGAIDKTKVTEELNALENKLQESLYENDTQRELGILSKNLILTRNMFNISLTRDDYRYYVDHRASFAAANYVNFIEAEAPLYRIKAALDNNITKLDQYREGVEGFYECSLERDKAFIKNIKFTDHDRPNSIIITGGFHTQNLRELFKKENVSYISIMPKFKNEPGYESPYLKRLAGQRTALENVIDTAIPAVLNLAVVEILSRELALKVEGEAGLATFKLAALIIAALERHKDQPFVIGLSKDLVIKGKGLDEDKVIIFTRGEGGNVSHEIKNLSNLKGGINSTNIWLASLEPLKYDLSPLQQTQVSEAPVAQKPIEAVTHKEEEVIMSGPVSGSMYEAAGTLAKEIAGALRRESPTYLISPVAFEGDIAGTMSVNRTAEQILGKQNQAITARGYLATGDWVTNLDNLLDKTLPVFEKDLSNPTARMAIRFMPDEEGKIIIGIKNHIRQFFKSRYSDEQIENMLEKQIHFIPIGIRDVKHLNAAIDLFTDLGMMEIDRYINNNYPGEQLPAQLRDRFVALLKLSITNFSDFKNIENIESILNAIFNAKVILQIRPVDWKSMDAWKKAQDEVLRAL